MIKETQAIEVEVVEIDGAAPPATFERREEVPPARQWQDWQPWQGRVRRLDSRWWPLWVFLGVIAVFLLLTVGVFLGIILVIFRILRRLIRALIR
ncbi:MAG: hypothetical protein WEB53_00825 [Akkermansiaceae bacterium]